MSSATRLGRTSLGPALLQGWVSKFIFMQRPPKPDSVYSVIYLEVAVVALVHL